MNMDPIAEEYNYMTPYQFASNNPLWNTVGNTEPSMVMGYRKQEVDTSSGAGSSIGGTKQYNYVPTIGFYNSESGENAIETISLKDLEKAVNQMDKFEQKK